MEVKLKVCVGAAAGKELPIPGPKFFIGRAEDCNLRPKSDLISRHHCVLMFEDASLIVRDLGSRNGTLVNDERVAGEIELNHGDHLKVGPLEFEVLIYVAKPSQKLPKVTSIKEAAARTAAGRESEASDPTEWLVSAETASPSTPVEEPPQPEEPVQAETETREITANETEEIDLAATLIDLPNPTKPAAVPKERPDLVYKPDPPEETPAPGDDASKRTDPGRPGKLPSRPRTADSGTAASDVLKKFFNRR